MPLHARAGRRRPDGAQSRRWRAGTLDVSVISAVEYARDAKRYLLLPDLSICSDGPVRSVVLFSKRPAVGAARPPRAREPELDDERRAARAAVRERLGREARVRAEQRRARPTSRGSATRSTTRASSSATRRCISGRACARRSSTRRPRAHAVPLRVRPRRRMEAWTGLPFVFAVWVAQRTAPVDRGARAFTRGLIASRDWGLQHLDALAAQAALATGVHKPVCARVSVGPRLRTVVPAPRRTDRILPAARRGGEGARTGRSRFFRRRSTARATIAARLAGDLP